MWPLQDGAAQWRGEGQGQTEETNRTEHLPGALTKMSHEIHNQSAWVFTPGFKPWSLELHSSCS